MVTRQRRSEGCQLLSCNTVVTIVSTTIRSVCREGLTQGSQCGQDFAAFSSSVVALTWQTHLRLLAETMGHRQRGHLGMSLFCGAALKPHWNTPSLLPLLLYLPLHSLSLFPGSQCLGMPFFLSSQAAISAPLLHSLPCRQTFCCWVSFLLSTQHLVTVSCFHPLRNSLKMHNLVSYYLSSNICFLRFFFSNSHFCLSISKEVLIRNVFLLVYCFPDLLGYVVSELFFIYPF